MNALMMCFVLCAIGTDSQTPALESIEVMSTTAVFMDVTSDKGVAEKEATGEVVDTLRIVFHPGRANLKAAEHIAASFEAACGKEVEQLSVEPWKEGKDGDVKPDTLRATARWKPAKNLYTMSHLTKVGPIEFRKTGGNELLIFSTKFAASDVQEKIICLQYIRLETRRWIREIEGVQTEIPFYSMPDPAPDPDNNKFFIYTVESVIATPEKN